MFGKPLGRQLIDTLLPHCRHFRVQGVTGRVIGGDGVVAVNTVIARLELAELDEIILRRGSRAAATVTFYFDGHVSSFRVCG